MDPAARYLLVEGNMTVLNESDYRMVDINQMEVARVIAASVWLLLVFTGLLGNGLVIFTIIKFNKLVNVTQCYLFNLAISDISFLIFCVPLTALSYIIDGWYFGRVVCKSYHYMSFVTVCATCLTLMMMTIDRYIYVCNRSQPGWRNTQFVFHVTCLIWAVSFLLSIPNLVNYDVDVQFYMKEYNASSPNIFKYESVSECVQTQHSFWSNFTQWYSTLVSYFIPSCVLIVCYVKILSHMTKNAHQLAQTSAWNGRISMYRKRRVTKTVIFLTLTFVITWFPVHALATWYRLDQNFPQDYGIFILKLIAHTMSYANSTVNPVIYAFSNESFRLNIRHLISKLSAQPNYIEKSIQQNKSKVEKTQVPKNSYNEISTLL